MTTQTPLIQDCDLFTVKYYSDRTIYIYPLNINDSDEYDDDYYNEISSILTDNIKNNVHGYAEMIFDDCSNDINKLKYLLFDIEQLKQINTKSKKNYKNFMDSVAIISKKHNTNIENIQHFLKFDFEAIHIKWN
jgi:hypothetical protein